MELIEDMEMKNAEVGCEDNLAALARKEAVAEVTRTREWLETSPTEHVKKSDLL